MSKKNKKNSAWSHDSPPAPVEVKVEKKLSRSIPLDPIVMQLLKKTATRNKVSPESLANLACEALTGSLHSYNYNPPTDTERQAPLKGDGPTIKLAEETTKQMNAIAVFFGVATTDIVRDAIMAQRYNWQRMQPVNARSMPSIRLQMFEQEQLGPR